MSPCSGSRSARSMSCVPTFARMTAGVTCSTTSGRPRAAPPSCGWTPRSKNSAGRWGPSRPTPRPSPSTSGPIARNSYPSNTGLHRAHARSSTFCGAIPGEDYLRPPTDTGVPAAALAQVTTITSDWLSSAGIAIWPGARSADGGFDWSQLHDTAGGSGLARLSSQYLRANIDPSERYVLSLPGTVQYRLAADGSGYDNLILAGDWTKTDWNVGCIEAAVTSGINAAAAVEGEPGSQAS